MLTRLATILLATVSLAAAAQAPPPGATVLQAGTQLVVVDVVVQDRDGHPVHGLKLEDFRLTESKSPQAIRNFEEHVAAPPLAHPPADLKLPPGIFTNYTPVPPSGALNVLLIDALNTPTKDQSYVRNQLQQYVKHASPGTRIAIFGLASRLILLQSFTSSPETLKDAVEHKLIPRGSPLLDDPTGSNIDTPSIADQINELTPELAQVAANVAEFEAMAASQQNQLRLQYTLDAFNSLGHYLAAFPGRKNLIWFSASFPINVLPDNTLQDPFSVVQVNEDEFRETTSLLSRAQVAVYPIDARGIMTNPAFDAANSGQKYARNPSAFSADLSKFTQSQFDEHSTMDSMASETGGHAFYNTNDLATAVAKAVDAGANYYTLTYAPANHADDGRYRDIRVDLTGAAAARGLTLAYRHGYYADDPHHTHKGDATAAITAAANAGSTPANAAAAAAEQHAANAYATAAMARGGPTPQDILFKLRVLPASTSTEATLAPDNVPDPRFPMKGPYQRYDLDFVALPTDFTLALQPDQRHTGKIQFIAYVYDVDGRLLNATGNVFTLNLPPDAYQRLMKTPINFHFEISAPARRETYLRFGVRDVPSNRFGVVELPFSTVSRLPPPVYPPAPAKPAPSKPAAAAPTPSTSPSATTPTATPPPQ
jgi:VWFA-related protein